jgi:predicted transcriptional regulator
MQIDPKVLAEENYTNPRLIELKNEEIGELYSQVLQHQEVVNPFLKRYEEIEAKKAELKAPYDEYVKETRQELEDMMEKMQREDQLASKIKEKLVPLVEDEVLPQLGDFDEFVGLEKIDGKLYAKVNDKIEEIVKVIRANKNKQP